MDKNEAIKQFKQTCATIEDTLEHIELTDIFETPRMKDIMDTFKIVTKDFRDSIEEKEIKTDEDTVYFIIEVVNSITSKLLINNINETLECFAVNFITLIDNWNREFGGNNKELKDSCRALITIIQAKDAFSTLIEKAQALTSLMIDIENVNRLAPRLSRHLLMELKEELENE